MSIADVVARRSARIRPSASRRYGSTPTSIDVLMM
jgi:hypothetical protein